MSKSSRRICRSLLSSWAIVAMTSCGSGWSAAVRDSDLDGLPDVVELEFGTDPYRADSDLDGLTDGAELDAGTSPLAFDSDHDGVGDGDDPQLDEPSRRVGSISSGNDVEPNDTLDQAQVMINVAQRRRVFEGRIDRRLDVDVFGLGPCLAGDRITIDFEHHDSSFRPVLAVFDDHGDVFDRVVYPFREPGFDAPAILDRVVRRDGAAYSLAVTHRHDDNLLGAYRLVVTIRDGGAAPRPRGQIVLLDFDGGALDPPILGESVIEPFRAGAIAEEYEGQDETLKAAIVDVVDEAFVGFDVTLITSDDVTPVDMSDVTTILLGSFHEAAFGAAVGVDPYNADPCDNGVVFTESFNSFTFGFTPSLEEIALAIGQVTAHEIGHLLGLRHVTDPAALMDGTSPSATLLDLQTFRRAILSPTVFPIGWQDAPLLLLDTVGID